MVNTFISKDLICSFHLYLDHYFPSFCLFFHPFKSSLCHQGACASGFVSPRGRKLLRTFVVSCQTVNTGFDQNQSELGIQILSVLLQVLTHGHGFTNHVVQILRDLRCQSLVLQNTKNLTSGDGFDLSDSLTVSQVGADGRRGESLTGECCDLLHHLTCGCFQPRRNGATVRERASANSLAISVHAAHDVRCE